MTTIQCTLYATYSLSGVFSSGMTDEDNYPQWVVLSMHCLSKCKVMLLWISEYIVHCSLCSHYPLDPFISLPPHPSPPPLPPTFETSRPAIIIKCPLQNIISIPSVLGLRVLFKNSLRVPFAKSRCGKQEEPHPFPFDPFPNNPVLCCG